jgi:ferredoxin
METKRKRGVAIVKDGAVRCSVCHVEIYEGVECGCGLSDDDFQNIEEAYNELHRIEAQKQEDIEIKGPQTP